MKRSLTILLILSVLILSGCSTLVKKEGLPPLSQIDEWIKDNKYGLALSSLERIPPDAKMFVAYVNKRKEVKGLAAMYEKNILLATQNDIDKGNWSAAILSLNTALNNYPTSSRIHERHNMVLEEQQKRINKLDAEALLARAKLLYNKLPISRKEVANSPINFAAQWDLQALESELQDMNTRLLTMAGQLIDDNEIGLAEMCIQQSRLLANDDKSLATIELLEEKVNYLNKVKLEAAEKKAYKERNLARLLKKKKHHNKVTQLVKKIKTALQKDQLILAEKYLGRLAKIEPDHKSYPELQHQHRGKVNQLVYKMTTAGDSLYRQEKIAEAKAIWEKALRYDTSNKTLQTQIRRANKVLSKLEKLRRERTAVRQ